MVRMTAFLGRPNREFDSGVFSGRGESRSCLGCGARGRHSCGLKLKRNAPEWLRGRSYAKGTREESQFG